MKLSIASTPRCCLSKKLLPAMSGRRPPFYACSLVIAPANHRASVYNYYLRLSAPIGRSLADRYGHDEHARAPALTHSGSNDLHSSWPPSHTQTTTIHPRIRHTSHTDGRIPETRTLQSTRDERKLLRSLPRPSGRSRPSLASAPLGSDLQGPTQPLP